MLEWEVKTVDILIISRVISRVYKFVASMKVQKKLLIAISIIM